MLLCEEDNKDMLLSWLNYVNKSNEGEDLSNDFETVINEYRRTVDIKKVIVSDIGEDPQLIEEKYEL